MQYTEQDFESTHPAQLAEFIGQHMIYTYDNGWQYELYIKNERSIDYRIHSGMVGGRWVRNQLAHICRLADGVVKISWDEPTGTTVSVTANLKERALHGVIFFPRWIAQAPEKTVCFQNEHTAEMIRLRDAGPTYPKLVIDEFARITFMEKRAADDETVVACAPAELSAGYAQRTN
ncbi:phenolic acid decarboxylase [Paracidovorax wautersii]|uniref:phenolic acid decarboxylase n=1 Tax=Paracidovorax wautersii TaxID=1177982 RepID=UPI0031DD790D